MKPSRKNEISAWLSSAKMTGYRHRDKDPILGVVNDLIWESGLTWQQICTKTGVSSGTIHNWNYGKTKRPQLATVNRVLAALGKQIVVIDQGVIPINGIVVRLIGEKKEK